MTIDDFEQVHSLWMEIHGFGIRSIDGCGAFYPKKSDHEHGGSL